MSRLSPEFLACLSGWRGGTRPDGGETRCWGLGSRSQKEDPGNLVYTQSFVLTGLGRLCLPGASQPLGASPAEVKVGGDRAWSVACTPSCVLRWSREGGPEAGRPQATVQAAQPRKGRTRLVWKQAFRKHRVTALSDPRALGRC